MDRVLKPGVSAFLTAGADDHYEDYLNGCLADKSKPVEPEKN